MGEASDEEFLQDLLNSHRLPSRRKDNHEEELLKDLLSSHRHSSPRHPITSHIDSYILLTNQTPQRLQPKADERTAVASTDDEKTITENRRRRTDSKEPKTKRQRTGDEKPTTLMTPTPTTKSQPTISGRTNVARQLDVPVPMGVLWDVCSFNACLTVKTVVEAQIPGSLCGGCKEQQPASYNEALSDTPASPGAMGLGVLPLSIGAEE